MAGNRSVMRQQAPSTRQCQCGVSRRKGESTMSTQHDVKENAETGDFTKAAGQVWRMTAHSLARHHALFSIFGKAIAHPEIDDRPHLDRFLKKYI